MSSQFPVSDSFTSDIYVGFIQLITNLSCGKIHRKWTMDSWFFHKNQQMFGKDLDSFNCRALFQIGSDHRTHSEILPSGLRADGSFVGQNLHWANKI